MQSSNTIKSNLPPLPIIPHNTLPSFLLDQVQKHLQSGHGGVYLNDGNSDKTLLYKDIAPLTRQLASALWRCGVRKGDIVIHLTSQQLQHIPLALSLWRINAIIRSLYKEDDKETIAEKVVESKCRLIFCDFDSLPMLEPIANELKLQLVLCGDSEDMSSTNHNTFQEFLQTGVEDFPEVEIDEQDTAIILPTSGTTGPSKGAVHTHASFLEIVRVCQHFPYTFHKRNLVASKGTHISGNAMPLGLMAAGVEGILLSQVDKESVAQAIHKFKPGYLYAFPGFITSLACDPQHVDVSSIEIVLTGGVNITPKIKDSIMKLPNVSHVVTAYGLTEGLTICGTNEITNIPGIPPTYPDTPIGSIGKLWPRVEAQIRNPRTMQLLGVEEKGELWVKGPCLFKGYYKNEEATNKAFVDGWFRTGDICYVDNNGFFFVVDRHKDIFKYCNNHISPTELENVLMSHKDVQQAVVIPIEDEMGHVPRAVITLITKPFYVEKKEITKEILSFSNEKLADYKRFRGGLIIVDDLPKGKTGKVSRQMVAKFYSSTLNEYV